MIRLPTELLAMIITLLVDPTTKQTKGALLAVSQVSKRLRAIALPHLFRATRVVCNVFQNTIQDYHTFLLDHPRIAEHVQELTLVGNWDREGTHTILTIARLKAILDSLPRLNTLSIKYTQFILPLPATPAPADVFTPPSRGLRALHFSHVELSPYVFLQILALFRRVHRIVLVQISPPTKRIGYAPTREDKYVYPPLPAVKHVRTDYVWPFASFAMPFVEPVTTVFAFALSAPYDVGSVAQFLRKRGGSVETLELGFFDYDLWDENHHMPSHFEGLRHAFASCTALTRIHLRLYMPSPSRSCHRNMFAKAVNALVGLPPSALKHLVIELTGGRHKWACVGKTRWAKLGAVCARFENVEGVGLMDEETGGPAELSKGLRTKLEELGLKVVPVWRESE